MLLGKEFIVIINYCYNYIIIFKIKQNHVSMLPPNTLALYIVANLQLYKDFYN